ncbi:MAG: DUF4381 family protein [Chitinophagaceae bacterium]|nr:DUF4381 family protein [Chitinophagaceae bacterium]
MISCFGSLLFVQAQPSLKATIDKNAILIGEQLTLKITATLPKQDFFIKWIEMPDSLEHFEVVEKSIIDSSFTNQKLTGLSQTITFTSFDSGKFVIPQLDASFTPSANDTSFNLLTDSFAVAVAYLADSTNTVRDIKTIWEVKDEIPTWYWIAGVTALLLLILIGYWLYKRYKNSGTILPRGSFLSAYQQAINELEKLKQSDLSSASAIKQYHSRLPEILKQYLAVKQGAFYGSNTTSEMLILLNQKNFDKTMLSKTAASLRCSDAVKFAKYQPAADESETCRLDIKEAIDFVEQQSNNIKKETA